MKTELYVQLIIPDNTALTAQRVLKKLGHAVAVRRYEYYELTAPSDIYEQAAACDVLVNANKHRSMRSLPESGNTFVKVTEREPAALLARELQRLDLPVEDVRKGVIWELDVRREEAARIAEELLYNRHYQNCEVIE